MTSITTNVLKNVLVSFLSDPWVYKFYLIQIKITNNISFVETGKNAEYSIWCATKKVYKALKIGAKTVVCVCHFFTSFLFSLPWIGPWIFRSDYSTLVLF